MILHKKLCKSAKLIYKKIKSIMTRKDLKDQTLKREIKYNYYIKTLKINN